MLTSRWTPLRPHPEQIRLINHHARFRVVPAGRRSGKTERAKRYLSRISLMAQKQEDGLYFAAAPTQQQAKRIFWKDLKKFIPRNFIKTVSNPGAKVTRKAISETELSVELINGSTIYVVGLDKPERLEGQPWNFGIVDEVANTKPNAWKENILPLFADRRGGCWFIGVPEGRNHYYDMAQLAQDPGEKDWEFFTWESADILPPDEIAFYKRTLDEKTFNQEFRATFESYAGLAYYPFEPKIHLATDLPYDPNETISFCFDFNVSPGVAIICQEMQLPNGEQGTGCIGEVHIPNHSNTPAVCNRLIQDWRNHRGPIEVYGDATGGARGTAQTQGSDWDLIKSIFRGAFRHVRYCVPKSNPSERARVNAVNSRLFSHEGQVRFMIDAQRCRHLADDFSHVETLLGGSGELDKSNKKYTHMTDAVGYYIAKNFPVRGGGSLSRVKILGRG